MGWSRTAYRGQKSWSPSLVDTLELSLDLVNGSYLASGLNYPDFTSYISGDPATFARSSTGFYETGSSLVSFSSGTPRTGVRGLLIEPSKTNIIQQSQALDNGLWTLNGGTRTANALVAPDGTTTAEQFVGTSNGNGVYGSDAAMTAGQQYTLSTYWKPISGTSSNFFGLSGSIFNSGSGDRILVINSTTTVTPANFTEATDYGIYPVGNGWYRVWVTFTATASATATFFMYYGPDSGSKTWSFWGAQAETGGLTSYIPTTTAAVTRPADDLVLSLPEGTTQLFVTLGDNSVVNLTGLSAGNYSFPTNLNNSYVKYISNRLPIVSALSAKAASTIAANTGIVTHYSWNGANYNTYQTELTNRILELGVGLVRDRHDSSNTDLSLLSTMASNGIKFLVNAEGGTGGANMSYTTYKTDLDLWPSGSIFAVEGYNEPNVVGATTSFQTDLYDGIRGDSNYNSALVLGPSVIDSTTVGAIGTSISSKMDAVNLHVYPYGERPEPQSNGYSALSWTLDTLDADSLKPGSPLHISEGGYHNYIPETGMPGVSQAASAVYGPRSIAHYLTHPTIDIRSYFRYEALDNSVNTNMEANFGILGLTTTPKPEFYTTKALLRTLRDVGGTAGTAKVALSGSNPNVYLRPLKRSDGRVDLLIWNAVDVWSTTTDTDIAVSDVTETVTLGENWSWAQVMNIKDGEAAAFKPLPIVSSKITMPIGPNITIVRLGTGTPPVSFVGAGVAANSLTLGVHANSVAGDYGMFFAMSPANDTGLGGSGLSQLTTANSASPSYARVSGGRVITGSGDSQSFTKTTGTFLRLLSLTFKNATGLVGTQASNAGTGTSITVPSMTVNESGSALIIPLLIKANSSGNILPIIVSGGLVNARLVAGTVNGSPMSCWYIVLQDISSFSGGTISWTGSAEYAYGAYVLR